jgi:hypothetical protein
MELFPGSGTLRPEHLQQRARTESETTMATVEIDGHNDNLSGHGR